MRSVFINYSWKHHSKEALKLYNAVSRVRGFKPWMDKKNLEPGLKWKPAIYKAINECQVFISLLSKESLREKGEKDGEIRAAINIVESQPTDKFYLIPALINECEPPHIVIQQLQWLPFYPRWQPAEDRLRDTLRRAKKDIRESAASGAHHYKVGIVDIDAGIEKLSAILTQLNAAQSFFRFTIPAMPPVTGVYERDYSPTQFSVHRVPADYIKKHRHAETDLLVFLTQFPLKFEENETNYMTGPHPADDRFLFVSTNKLKTYCRQAKCSFEEGIVFLIAGQLVSYFSSIDFHDETRYCVMDFCEDLSDVVYGLIRRNFCNECYAALPNDGLKTAVQLLLSWRYQQSRVRRRKRR